MISQEKTLIVENKKRIILWRAETPILISTTTLYHDNHHVIAIQQTTTGCDNHEELQLFSTLDEVINVGFTVTDTEETDFVVADSAEKPSISNASPPTKKPRSSGRPALESSHKDMSMKGIGGKLFNIMSSKINNCNKNETPETFDSEYYLDQLDPSKRKKVIHVTKVTKEYMEIGM